MRYFVIHSSGQKYGPADLATLNQWVGEGRIMPGTELEDEATGSRLSAASVPGLNLGGPAPSTSGAPAAPAAPVAGPGFQTGPANPSSPYGAPTSGPNPGMPSGPNPYSQAPQYGQAPTQNPYQRGPVMMGDAQGDFNKSIIFSIMGVLCCPIVFSVLGIYFGKRAKDLGHPNGQLAFNLGIVSLIVGIVIGGSTSLSRFM